MNIENYLIKNIINNQFKLEDRLMNDNYGYLKPAKSYKIAHKRFCNLFDVHISSFLVISKQMKYNNKNLTYSIEEFNQIMDNVYKSVQLN